MQAAGNSSKHIARQTPCMNSWRPMTLQRGDVVLIRMQFHQAQGSKVRPALVLLDTGDEDFVAAPVTSQARAMAFDLTLLDWQRAGLNVPSSARIHKCPR
jgi:mRNA interferase MazF